MFSTHQTSLDVAFFSPGFYIPESYFPSMLSEEQVDAFLARYVKDGKVIAVGTNQLGDLFLRKLGLLCEQNKWETPLIPTSTSQIHTAQQFH